MNLHLMKVFQTTSVASFNSLFEQCEKDLKLKDLKNKVSASSSDPPPDPFDILTIASTEYLSLVRQDLWNGVNTSGNESVFITLDGESRCFNCNEVGCTVEKCPKPKDPERIAANKKMFWNWVKSEKKKDSNNQDSNDRGGRLVGKFAPPSKKEKNCRVIDGKAMKFDKQRQEWSEDSNPPDNIKALIVPPKTSDAGPADRSSAVAEDAESLNATRLRVANASKSIQAALAGLTSSF